MAINLKTFFPGPTLRTTLARPTAVAPVAPTQGTRGGESAQTRDPRGLGNLRKNLSPIRSNTHSTRGNARPVFGALRPTTTGVTIGGTIKRLPPSGSYQHAVHALGQPGASRPKFRPLTADQGMRPTVLRLPPEHARTSPGAPPPSLASSASSSAGTSSFSNSSVGREGSQFSGGSTNSSGHQSHGYNLQTYRLPDSLGNSPTSSLSDLSSFGSSRPVSPASLGSGDSLNSFGERVRHSSTSSLWSESDHSAVTPSDTSRSSSAASGSAFRHYGSANAVRRPVSIDSALTPFSPAQTFRRPVSVNSVPESTASAPSRLETSTGTYSGSPHLSAASSTDSLFSKDSLESQVSDVLVPPARLRAASLPANSWINNTGHVEKIGSNQAYFASEHAERSSFRPELEGLPGDQAFPVVPKMQRGDVTRLFATQDAAAADFFRQHPSRPGQPLDTYDSYQVDLNNLRIADTADNYVLPGGPLPTTGKLPPPGTANAPGEIHVRTDDVDTTRIKRL